MNSLRPLAAAFLALAASPVFAQGNGAFGIPERVQTRVAASRLNSRAIVPQIDTRLTEKPGRPRNPAQPPDLTGIENQLPTGRIVARHRVDRGGLFPAVGNTGWTPPDPDLAVGRNHIVAVVNSSVAFFSKSGTKQYQQTASTFFTGMGAGTFLFDPKCLYDRVHDRFVVIFLEQSDTTETSKVLLAVSDDGDPNGTWYRYRLEARLDISGQGYWLDYPGLGGNKDAYVVSGNMFGFTSGFGGAQFLVIPSAPALAGGAVTVTSLRDPGGASVQIADVVDPSREVVFGVSRYNGSSLRVYGIRDPGTATPAVVTASVTVPSNSAPSGDAPSTSGTLLDTIDGRVFTAVWRGGRLVTGHTASASGVNFVRWYEVNTNSWPESGAPSLVQSGDISQSGLHCFTPALSVNAFGAISCLFTASSAGLTADYRVAGRASGDPLGAMGTPVTLESSAGTNYTRGRWGDYFGVDVDPVDDATFWGIGMTVAADNNWRTSIYSWTVSSPGNSAPTVSIAQPIAGATFSQGASVAFSGSASDAQDGDLSASLTWTSSLQGTLGAGASFSRADLVPGTHVITASVTDSGSLTGSASVTITVQSPNTPPAAPTNLVAAKASTGVARLTWTDNASNETNFDIERERKSSKAWDSLNTITVGANVVSINDAAGTGTFRYRIRSRNASGASAWSGWVQVRL